MQCRNCPFSLRCLAGRLGFIGLCPDCGIVTLDSYNLTPVRLRCERRTKELCRVPVPVGDGFIIWDPIGKTIGISLCGKCKSQDVGVRSNYDTRQIDLNEEGGTS